MSLLLALIPLACIATAAVHWPALSARAYSFDDAQYLLKNPLVQEPSWTSARRFLAEVLAPSTVAGYYQPLAMISLMLDSAWGGTRQDLRPFHRTSLALHVINTGLVITLLYLLFGSAWAAAIVGLLFGVHPLTVEPIPWIGERKTVLAAFFALSCLIFYVLYATRDVPSTPIRPGRGRMGLYIAALAAFLLALLSKPTTTPIPVLLLLVDYWPLGRLSRRSLLEKVPFFALAGVSAVITVISQARTASVTLPGERPLGWIPLTLAHNVIFYLLKIVWPANLSSHYPFPEPMSLANPMVLAGVLGTGVLLAILAFSWRRTRALVTGWLFFFVAIFPTMGVIGFTDVIASDKFAYLPSVGLMIVPAWAVARLLTPKADQTTSRRRRMTIAVVAIASTIAATEAVATRRYLAVWQDTDRFWRYMMARAPSASMLRSNYAGFLIDAGQPDEGFEYAAEALALDPENYMAHNTLGGVLLRRENAKDALDHFNEALRIRPDDYIVHGNLAAALIRLDRPTEAMEHYNRSLELRPTSPEVHHNLAGALAQQGRIDEAVAHYQEAARLNPRWAEPHNRIGVVLASQGKTEDAIARFSAALALKPGWDEAHKNLGAALAQMGRTDEAIEHYAAALRANPHLPDVHYNLASAMVARGRAEEALPHYREAVRLRPDDAEAHARLAQALVKLGEFDGAVEAYGHALGIRPGWSGVHNDLGVLLAQLGRINEAIAHFKEAVRLQPDWVEAQRNLALALSQGAKP